jgi:hypothetical protein
MIYLLYNIIFFVILIYGFHFSFSQYFISPIFFCYYSVYRQISNFHYFREQRVLYIYPRTTIYTLYPFFFYPIFFIRFSRLHKMRKTRIQKRFFVELKKRIAEEKRKW